MTNEILEGVAALVVAMATMTRTVAKVRADLHARRERQAEARRKEEVRQRAARRNSMAAVETLLRARLDGW
jgi:hypothetical protein